MNLVHHVMSNLVPRIRVIPQIGRDKAHEFFTIHFCLVRWVRIVVLDQLLVTFEGVASQAFLELSTFLAAFQPPAVASRTISSLFTVSTRKFSMDFLLDTPTGLDVFTPPLAIW